MNNPVIKAMECPHCKTWFPATDGDLHDAKVCLLCKQLMPLYTYSNGKGAGGTHSYCKLCQREYARKHRLRRETAARLALIHAAFAADGAQPGDIKP